jgi:hypothetical protein
MKILNHNNREFLIAHLQGGAVKNHFPVQYEFERRQVVVPEDITIITVATGEPGQYMLLAQLAKNNIPCVNLAAGFTGEWNNTMKIGYIVDALKQVPTPYALILDAADVLIGGDITGIIDLFLAFNKKIVFNATASNHPPVDIGIMDNSEDLGKFKYLNAGCCIGETSALLDFYEEAMSVDIDNPLHSEQLIIRAVFANHKDIVTIDHQCTIFQTFGKTAGRQIDENTSIIE